MEPLDILIFVSLALMSFVIIGAGIAYAVLEYRRNRHVKHPPVTLLGVVRPKDGADDA